MARDTLFAMPSSSIILLFAVALGGTSAFPWAGAEQTATYVPHAWTPRPTGVPDEPAQLFKRDAIGVDVCGWIGGDVAKAVTCGAGSSCIHDTAHARVGCCTTDGPCTQGVYTTCQDRSMQGWNPSVSIVNNGVLTCSSSAACYQNTYPGNYMQWACGDATQGASLVTSYSNQPSDLRLQLVYTGVAFSPMPANPSTTGASSTQTAAPSGTSNSASPAALGKTAPGSSASSTPAPVAKSNTAAIAGGSVAAAAGVSLIAAFAFWFFRRKNRTAKKQRVTSFMARPRGGPPAPLNERSFNPQPFQPIRPDSPEDWVSPMTGHPANASSRSIFPENIQASYNPPNKSMFPGSSEMAYNAPSHRPLFPETDTAYHGAGGDIADLVNVDIDDASSTHSPRSLCHPFEGPTPGPTPKAPQNPSFEGLSLHTKSIPYENIHNAAAPAHSHEYSPPPPSQFPQFSPTHSPTNMTFPAHFGDDHPLNQLMDNDQGLPLMHSSEIDEFASNWHDAVVAQQVQEDLSHDAAVAQRLQDSLARATRIHDLEQSRDTHIHDGQMPNTATATGLGVASAVPLRKAVPVRQASVAAAGGQGRVHDREARSEALRDMGRSENVRMEGWSPRRLQTVRAYAESVASGRSTPSDGESIRNVGSGGSSLRNVSMRDVGGDIREIEIPAKSPLRADHGRGPNPERLSFGLNHAISNAVGMSADGSRQKYQLVDDVLGERDVVPDIIPPVQNPSRKGPTGRRISELE